MWQLLNCTNVISFRLESRPVSPSVLVAYDVSVRIKITESGFTEIQTQLEVLWDAESSSDTKERLTFLALDLAKRDHLISESCLEKSF
jgi:hypothetical protein